MTILVIEDDENKLSRLREFLAAEYPDIPVTTAGSFRGGRDLVGRKDVRIVLLDMALPTYEASATDEAEFQFFAGKEILRKMERRHIDTPVIVVTQFESFGQGEERQSLQELKNELEQRFKANYRGTVYYNAAIDNWKHELRELMKHAFAEGRRARA